MEKTEDSLKNPLKNPFIQFLEQLRDNENTAALATLKKGLMKEPSEELSMYSYIIPWLGNKNYIGNKEKMYFTIASLFAYHPQKGDNGSIGNTLKRIALSEMKDSSIKDINETPISKRFMALLNCHIEDLHLHLRQIISICSSNEIAINWHKLFHDVLQWNSDEKWIQKNWAKDFWRYEKEDEPKENKKTKGD